MHLFIIGSRTFPPNSYIFPLAPMAAKKAAEATYPKIMICIRVHTYGTLFTEGCLSRLFVTFSATWRRKSTILPYRLHSRSHRPMHTYYKLQKSLAPSVQSWPSRYFTLFHPLRPSPSPYHLTNTQYPMQCVDCGSFVWH